MNGRRGGGMGPHALSYISDSGVARICERGGGGGQSEGAKRPSGRGPRVGRFFCVSKWPSLQLNVIIRGSLCSGVDQFPTLFPHFHFLLADQQGDHGPLCPP